MPSLLRSFLHLTVLLGLTLSLSAKDASKVSGKHLFILSGQSNMTGNVRNAFTDKVHDHFGEENAVVVMKMKSGRGIRFWVPDYNHPAKRGFRSNGEEYKPLIDAALAASKGKCFDTVGFVWMQGESDANNRLSEVYEVSFQKLIKQLKKDLGREDLYFVIGRINDYARSRPDNEHWKKVREIQVTLGSTKGNAWIDTDDLNGGDANKPDGDIHFPKEGANRVGQRFAEKAIQLIENR